jgi:hypothetical protein
MRDTPLPLREGDISRCKLGKKLCKGTRNEEIINIRGKNKGKRGHEG